MAGRPKRRARQARARKNSWGSSSDFRSRTERQPWSGGWGGTVPIGKKRRLSIQASAHHYSSPRAGLDSPLDYTAWEVGFIGPDGHLQDPRTVNDSCVNAFIRAAGFSEGTVAAYVDVPVIQAFLDAVAAGCVEEEYSGRAWGDYGTEEDDSDADSDADSGDEYYDWREEQASRERAQARAAQAELPLGKFLSVCDRVRGGSTPHERNTARRIVLSMIEKYPGIEDAASTWAKTQKRPGCRVKGKAGSGPEPVREAPKDSYSGPARVERDGKIAVIISPTFGGGWSTWNSVKNEDIMLFHPLLVELIESDQVNSRTVEAVFARLGAEMPSYSFRDRLAIDWIPKGALFQVREYDGSESTVVFDESQWMKANPQPRRPQPSRPRRKRRR